MAEDPNSKIKSLVWRIRGEKQGGHRTEVVFADKDKAESVSQIRNAIEKSKTWGDFKKRMPPDEYERLLAVYMENHPMPREKTRFDCGDCAPEFCDGDYPDWLQGEMLDWFPKEVAAKYGRIGESMLNGDYLKLPAGKAEAIAEDLRKLGYEVTPRPRLNFF